MNDNKDHYRINKYSSSYLYSLSHVENVFVYAPRNTKNKKKKQKTILSLMTEELVQSPIVYEKNKKNQIIRNKIKEKNIKQNHRHACNPCMWIM